MAKFQELPENEQIEKVKDTFVEILSSLAEDSNKIGDYVTIPAKPADLAGNATDAEKAGFAKSKSEFDEKTAQVAKIKELLTNVERPEGCFCGTCVTIKFGDNIPNELEFLIEEAQKKAEQATY